jgi:hypothetical protein
MTLRFGSLALVSLAALSAAALASNDARACGGCFHPEDQPETTLVTAHRMAFAVSPAQTVLWDQVQFSGAPSEFAWVLPIKPGAYVELSNDAWFESLDAATSTRVVAPQITCKNQTFNDGFEGSSNSGCGCGSSLTAAEDGSASGSSGDPGREPPPTVTVVHEGSVGPYDTVTLHANVQGALTDWLTMHSFAIDPAVKPIIDAYSAEGFDFIALRLQPGQGVQQMKPVRVVSPGATPTLPLRMVAAGTGANVQITLFVIGEGRWESKNFPNGAVDTTELSWDFSASASNYAALRQKVFASGEGRSWINSYAKHGPLLSPVNNPVTFQPVQYVTQSQFNPTSTIGDFYVQQGLIDNETTTDACRGAFLSYADSADLVVDVCPGAEGTGSGGGSGTGGAGGAGGAGAGGAGGAGAGGAPGTGGAGGGCGMVQAGQIDARELACGPLDDMGVALTGMHPRDVWVTRLESNLPHAALKDDFEIQAASAQGELENWLTATVPVNPPCELATVVPRTAESARKNGGGGPSTGGTRTFGLLALALAAAGAALSRRARRPRVVRLRALRPAAR